MYVDNSAENVNLQVKDAKNRIIECKKTWSVNQEMKDAKIITRMYGD